MYTVQTPIRFETKLETRTLYIIVRDLCVRVKLL